MTALTSEPKINKHIERVSCNKRSMSNVYRQALQPCSRHGEAVTGYTRNGLCQDVAGDRGSHHVCMNIQLRDGSSFCARTGQPEWCGERSACHGDPTRVCRKAHWCVCQWAFARAVRELGCDQIDLDCGATSLRALEAYDSHPRYAQAARCLRHKCSIRAVSIPEKKLYR